MLMLDVDGLGPTDFGYPGPDIGEADGQPDPGEPDFDFLDKDEADQIGLTGFRIFPVHTYELWNEKQNWGCIPLCATSSCSQQVTANLGMFFSSGPFPLGAGDTAKLFNGPAFWGNVRILFLQKIQFNKFIMPITDFPNHRIKPQLLSVIPETVK